LQDLLLNVKLYITVASKKKNRKSFVYRDEAISKIKE